MSEQKTNLDGVLHQFRQTQNFEEYATSLSKSLHLCTTKEERELVREVIKEQKQRLMETNPEFRAIMEQRKINIKMRVDHDMAAHNSKINEANAMIKAAKAGGVSAKMQAKTAKHNAANPLRSSMLERDLDDWVASTKIKVRTREEAEADLDDKPRCPNPKCVDHGKNRNNIINGIHACMRCRHKLVPKSKFKDYNRAYWRIFNKKKG